MPPPLSPGIFAGRILDFDTTDSMAWEIEDALAALIGPLPTAPPKMIEDRRKLFIAISTGVIQHLKKHESEFVVTDPEPSSHTNPLVITLRT